MFSRQARARRRTREPLPGKTRILLGAATLGLFLAARRFPEVAEQLYARRAYPFLADALGSISGLFPVGLAEWVFLLIVLSILWAVPTYFRRMRRALEGWPRSVAAGVLGLVARAAMWWSLFVVLWGFNYARPPVARSFDLPPPPAKERREAILRRISARLEEERGSVREDDAGVVAETEGRERLDRHLLALQADALREQALPSPGTCRVKRPVASALFLRWSVSGFYGPFTGEPHVVRPAPPGCLPFTMAHEIGHFAGFASEDAASFVAFLTCWRSERPEVRYSAWLRLYLDLGGGPDGRSAAVRRDLDAIADFLERHRPGREARWLFRGYDRFLQAHGAEGGTAGYGRASGLALRWIERHGMPRDPSRTGL